MRRYPLFFWLMGLFLAWNGDRTIAQEPESVASPADVFESRIMPIFRSEQPSSCVQCHLSSVDLKDYIRGSQEETFASLRDQGLVDIDHPLKSKILNLIQMGEQDRDEGARLIHAKTRQAEYEAFAAWIKACCADPQMRDLAPLADQQQAAPEHAVEVIRHTRKSRIIDSFARNIWSQRMRCYPCHTPHEIDHDNPKHQKAIEKSVEFADKYGERMHLFKETPEATFNYFVKRSKKTPAEELPLINIQEPRKSLILLKPTSKLPQRISKGVLATPSYQEPVSHMGGLKMHHNDHSYKAFVRWLEDYARSVGGEYKTAAELPIDNWVPTQHALLMRPTPESWPAGVTVQLFVHAKRDDGTGWSKNPIAFTQGKRNPRGAVYGVLFKLAPQDSGYPRMPGEGKAQLPPGDYLIKAYVDSQGRLAKDPSLMLGEEEYAGEFSFNAKWGEGFAKAARLNGELIDNPN